MANRWLARRWDEWSREDSALLALSLSANAGLLFLSWKLPPLCRDLYQGAALPALVSLVISSWFAWFLCAGSLGGHVSLLLVRMSRERRRDIVIVGCLVTLTLGLALAWIAQSPISPGLFACSNCL